MSKKILKYTTIVLGFLILLIIYLSTVGFETDKFNNQIQNLVKQKNDKFDTSLKKIKLTLDPLNFKINAKTIDTKILFKDKLIELEYIKTQISLNSFIKSQLVTSQIEISTKPILLKNFVSFIRSINNKPELFFLEQFINKGYLIADLKFNFDEFGKLKEDYKINGILKEGEISILKKNKLEKINFLFNVTENNFDFREISFDTNNVNFLSEKLSVKKDKKDYLIDGNITNKNSPLNDELLKKIKLKYPQFDLINTNFRSENDFLFNINNNFKVKNLTINSSILIDSSQLKKNNLISEKFMEINELIDLKNHNIKASYANKKLKIEGKGQVKLQNKFEFIDYELAYSGSDLNLVSNIELSELDIKNQNLIKEYLPKTKDILNLKDHKIKLQYKNSNLSVEGLGKISLDKEFNKINYTFSKKDKKYNFETDLEINDTPIKIDFINYEKDNNLNSQLKINGNYNKKFGLDLKKISFFSKNNRISIDDLMIDGKNKIVKVDKIDLDYFDISDKKNKFVINRIRNNDYELNGSILNADSLITNLLKSNNDQQLDIFKENINIKLNLSDVYLDKDNIVKNLNGKLGIVDNKISQANISALFANNKNLIFTINTKEGQKITTLFSSRAKPLVKRYKFIKGFEDSDEGYLDFYSSKKNGISNSKLIIDNFKVKEIPALAKLLALASLQGIADLLTGEGIRFTDFEMNFTNKNKVMTIQELYAIGPAISILIDGYISENNIVSLRGTLVPATTINRSIASIPLIGDLLIGKKAGEGVFGVSFKVKGPPKNLETNVNPIKTLTPRFITRTLEKIKKN
ncbi:AsmA-like C-terminal region-containing protein [Candidatus Pelagibacter sp.]|nr:AsmA-like C-terminal region-containing protein [Candidatus Pelagibacter sp.]